MREYKSPHEREVEAYDSDRSMAFKRIREKFYSSSRRRKEMLKWRDKNPSPRLPEEQMRNLKRALWD